MDQVKKHKGKELLSLLEKGDFTNTGEEKAIQLVMQKFPYDDNQLILDVGCRLGGTANFIQNNGWGTVIGIDIEPESIEYAKTHYPNVDFHTCDVVNIDQLFTIALFDITSLFNVYCSLHNPRQTLHALQKVTKQGGHIAIFDYSDLCNNQLNPLSEEGDPKTNPFHPIKKDEIESLLSMTGWLIDEIIDISDKYTGWHQNLFDKLTAKKTEVIHKFGQDIYNKYYDIYNDILIALQKKLLGGIIIYATRK